MLSPSTTNVPLALQYLKIVTSPAMQATQWDLLKQLPTTTAAANALAKESSLAAPFVASEESASPDPLLLRVGERGGRPG